MPEALVWPSLESEPLRVADFRVEATIMNLGRSPFSERRVGYITGGEFRGPWLGGEILPGGGNWSLNGELPDGVACGLFDARALWRCDDGAMIHVSYSGRNIIPADVAARFRAPGAGRRAAVGCGERMPWGIRHWIFAIR